MSERTPTSPPDPASASDLDLDQAFLDVYSRFKMHFYQSIFGRFENREATLTALEVFCVEAIDALEHPTIGEFADFVNISLPNASYRVQCLMRKGYVIKYQSKADKREFRLAVTQRFKDYAKVNSDYVAVVMQRVQQRFSAEELRIFENVLQVMSNDLMPEYSAGLE